MKYQIVNCNSDNEIGFYILENVLIPSYHNNNLSILGYWLESYKDIYNIIFNFNSLDRKNQKNIKRRDRKIINNIYSNLTLINMYEFLGTEKPGLEIFSTKQNFISTIDNSINFLSFNTDNTGKVDIDLLVSPHNYDKKIKSVNNSMFDLAIFKIDSNNVIPFLECYVENIGTNISSLEFDDWTESSETNFDQSINIGTKFLSCCKKICVILDESEIVDIFNNEKNTIISRLLKTHDDVTYLIKKNK